MHSRKKWTAFYHANPTSTGIGNIFQQNISHIKTLSMIFVCPFSIYLMHLSRCTHFCALCEFIFLLYCDITKGNGCKRPFVNRWELEGGLSVLYNLGQVFEKKFLNIHSSPPLAIWQRWRGFGCLWRDASEISCYHW